MYKRILIPLDGSDLAEVVFTYVKELAGRLGLDVVLLHVSWPDAREFTPMRQAYIERAANTIRHQIKAVQKKIGIQPEDKPLKVHGELATGYPAEEILRYADEKTIDLVIMATHGRSGLKRWVMGNVADKILRVSKIPVLLVRTGIPIETTYDKWPKITILVLLDGSELAESVLPHAKVLVKQQGIKPDMVLLKVCEPSTTPAYYAPELSGVPLNWGEYAQQETVRCKQEAKEYLARIEKRLKNSHISSRSEVLVGKAAEEIVDYANTNPFNLIVMATHGRTGISRWVYSSVAENVLEGVSSPILLIRSQ
jgi:nucleotide-binding universal stress UspA family protein